MAARRALKVFRTAIGFADAYIAAPSQKAALDAWGATSNLFARGMAEVVTDPALAAPALARPGEILRVPRGTAADHLAAAKEGDDARQQRRAAQEHATDRKGARPSSERARPQPRPSRHKLDAAQAALERRRSELAAQRAEIDARIEALRAERARIKADSDAEIARLTRQVEREEKAYRDGVASVASGASPARQKVAKP